MTWDGQFGDPQLVRGDRFSCVDAQGKVLIVRPLQYVSEILTQRGDKVDAIKVDVVNLSAAGQEQQWYQGTLWFGGRLVGMFRGQLGTPFIGHVHKERTPQGFDAWTFTSMGNDPQVVAAARAWVQQNPEFMVPLEQHPHVEAPHREQGPQPAWSQGPLPVPGLSAQPAAPPGPPQVGGANAGPPALGGANAGPPQLGGAQVANPWPEVPVQQSSPPAMASPTVPAPTVPEAPIGAAESILDRLRRQAERTPTFGQKAQPQEEPPF